MKIVTTEMAARKPCPRTISGGLVGKGASRYPGYAENVNPPVNSRRNLVSNSRIGQGGCWV